MAGWFTEIPSMCQTTDLFGCDYYKITTTPQLWATQDGPRPWNCLQEDTIGHQCGRMSSDSYGIATPATERRRHVMPPMEPYGLCQYQSDPGSTFRLISSLAYRYQKVSMPSVLWWIA